MSSFTRFSTELDLRYKSERVWVVLTPFSYDVGSLGSGITVDVPVGYVTDGGSIPQALWGILSPWEENCGQAFVVHDILCDHPYLTYHQDSGKLLSVKITRERADDILREALEVLGVTQWKVEAIMTGLALHRKANHLV